MLALYLIGGSIVLKKCILYGSYSFNHHYLYRLCVVLLFLESLLTTGYGRMWCIMFVWWIYSWWWNHTHITSRFLYINSRICIPRCTPFFKLKNKNKKSTFTIYTNKNGEGGSPNPHETSGLQQGRWCAGVN